MQRPDKLVFKQIQDRQAKEAEIRKAKEDRAAQEQAYNSRPGYNDPFSGGGGSYGAWQDTASYIPAPAPTPAPAPAPTSEPTKWDNMFGNTTPAPAPETTKWDDRFGSTEEKKREKPKGGKWDRI